MAFGEIDDVEGVVDFATLQLQISRMCVPTAPYWRFLQQPCDPLSFWGCGGSRYTTKGRLDCSYCYDSQTVGYSSGIMQLHDVETSSISAHWLARGRKSLFTYYLISVQQSKQLSHWRSTPPHAGWICRHHAARAIVAGPTIDRPYPQVDCGTPRTPLVGNDSNRWESLSRGVVALHATLHTCRQTLVPYRR